jgi:hypothetical protein
MLVVGSALWACTPPHYSVGVARGPDHVTFAQRHHNVQHNDYLVDCAIDANGRPTKCKTIELVAE